MAAANRGIPYQQVEYLKRADYSNGSRIDMGVYGMLGTEVGVTYMVEGNGSSYAIAGSRGTNNNLTLFAGSGNNDQRFGNLSVKATTAQNVRYAAVINKDHFVRSDGVDLTLGYTVAFTTLTTLQLFGWNRDNYGMVGRIYSAYVKQDGVLVRDFVPVRVDNVGYMYDKVSGQLFGNVGGSDFIIGNDIN